MTIEELAEHIELLDQAVAEDHDELLEDLLEVPYADLEHQNN